MLLRQKEVLKEEACHACRQCSADRDRERRRS